MEDDPGKDGEIHPCLFEAKAQLEAYFSGELQEFDLPLQPEGTPFQATVWNALLGVPFGDTCSYGDIAHAIRNTKASQAVGAANGKNPLSIIVPCHRVIGSSGKLVGYAGKIWRKKWLLDHEAKHSSGYQTSLF
ncbi:UNVERIFIED_CONTAM: hypothetical protein GTU68_012576 [Idotea baltica]|nr:hypothetical protein [Idotea baltica]